MRWLVWKRDRVRVIIYGTHSPDWMAALGPGAPVWRGMPGVVTGESAGIRTVVIPLLEDHIASCPTSYERLIPSERALRVLRDKAEFASYVQSAGLANLCPKIFPDAEAAQFPCVLKRVDLNGGVGVRVVNSSHELRASLAEEPWRGQPYLLQSFVAGSRQFVAHCVCKDGRIRWHCTYAYAPTENMAVRNAGRPMKRMTEPASRLADFEALLAPLSFSGPCNIDYKLTDSGQTVIFEINPRLGGSLMRPGNVEDLRAALSSIITLSSAHLERAGRLH